MISYLLIRYVHHTLTIVYPLPRYIFVNLRWSFILNCHFHQLNSFLVLLILALDALLNLVHNLLEIL